MKSPIPDSSNRRTTADRARVLIVAPRVVASFSIQDAEILSSAFDVRLFSFQGVRSLPALHQEIKQADCVLIWFVGRHTSPTVWLARRAGVPVIVIVGGYEVFWIPEIRYGVPPASFRARLIRWVLRRSQRVLAVSEVVEQAISQRVPDICEKIRLIHNAVDPDRFRYSPGITRSGVLSVGQISAVTIRVKRWWLLWETAARMPDTQFTLVGPARDRAGREFVSAAPPNVTWLGGVYGDGLPPLYQSASVYFQPSRHESFSLAVGEAMASGCIPVVGDGGMLPKLVGERGIVLERPDSETAMTAIREALDRPDRDRQALRQRIINNFSRDRRRELLSAEISSLLVK